jgi:hypothetical protein
MIDYSKLDYLELLELCKKRKIKGYGHQKKKRIIELLKEDDKALKVSITEITRRIYILLGITGYLISQPISTHLTNYIHTLYYFRKTKIENLTGIDIV